jgi:putative spermidine/putrescine transport system ATP-binding protein/spermidine/putrescine transport system ATP-binding protein
MVTLGGAQIAGARSDFPDAAAGAAADIFIRPEALRLAEPGETAIAQGTVGAQVFQGSHTDIFIDTPMAPSGRVLIRPPASDGAARLPLGSSVSLAITGPHSVSIFPPESA